VTSFDFKINDLLKVCQKFFLSIKTIMVIWMHKQHLFKHLWIIFT
jgi:hypothetical protein